MINNILKIDKKDCCGCNACFSICPENAIRMVPDTDGFKIPLIDSAECVNCGVCLDVCQVIKNLPENMFKQKYYVGFAKDLADRYASSSGGVYSVIANYFLAGRGYICGAVFENCDLCH